MLLSKSCVYAIRAALLVSIKVLEGDRQYIPVKELSDELNISFHFLTKILQKLTDAKLMGSFRGPKGGVALIRPADSIHVIEIIEAIDGLKSFDSCLLGLPDCSENKPCPFHDHWKSKRSELLAMFENETLSDITKSRDKFNLSG